MDAVKILGTEFAALDLDGAVRWIEARAAGRERRHVVATGFHGVWLAMRDASVRQMLRRADLVLSDGGAPVLIGRLAGRRLPGRVPGPDIMEEILRRSPSNRLTSFLLGDTPETLGALSEVIRRHFPEHRVVGAYSPSFGAALDAGPKAISLINASKPDLLWVALGFPKQDLWIERNLCKLDVGVAIGVGAAFKFLAGCVSRAPKLLRHIGLEWLWRLLMEPNRLWYRALVEGPLFMCCGLGFAIQCRCLGIGRALSREL
jgi:N-acetylglucosaminyldiphosphoundecaprenol N-acetyl-beta-D-mannosaminyltransferase